MNDIQDIALELVRPGPAHNQLLSPLTPYIALCGGDSPVNVTLPFEHRHLLMRIQRLRYELESGMPTEVQTAQRQAELREMGELLGEFLGRIPALLAQLSRTRCGGGKLAHLRLSLCADELSMVPFETAISPTGFPGTGLPLFLQTHTPVAITREIRRNRPLLVQWDRPPKILFAFASPPGLPQVPAEQHLQAIRDALTPWIKIKDDCRKRVSELKKFITVLPDASLQEIDDCCNRESFTYIHILAHGAPFDNAGEKRYGLALCNHDDKSRWDVVDGESLGIALTGKDATGTTQFAPTLVSLAVCDSGNINSIISPGGSIAHMLHYSGIPWVVASQFPLWMSASVIAVRELFSGILEGEDPRWVLYGLRQKLRTDCPHTHDWASIVAYASLPADFERQVSAFRERQTQGKVEVKLNRLEDLFALESPDANKSYSNEQIDELRKTEDELRDMLNRWCKEDVPLTDQIFNPGLANRLGLSAASEKRLGTAYQAIQLFEEQRSAYRSCRDFYRQAVEADPTCTWLITQYLSMHTVFNVLHPSIDKNRISFSPFGIDPNDWWFIGVRLCKAEAEVSDEDRLIDALTSLVELNLVGWFYNSEWKLAKAREEIGGYVDKLIRWQQPDSLQLIALRRQLKRYMHFWKSEKWDELAQEIYDRLRPE